MNSLTLSSSLDYKKVLKAGRVQMVKGVFMQMTVKWNCWKNWQVFLEMSTKASGLKLLWKSFNKYVIFIFLSKLFLLWLHF